MRAATRAERWDHARDLRKHDCAGMEVAAPTLTPQQELYYARANLLGCRDRLAKFRRYGDLNSIDRDLHANEVQNLYRALDMVWAAQLAVA